jgi:DNA-binding NarL/FixJ family response regulator
MSAGRLTIRTSVLTLSDDSGYVVHPVSSAFAAIHALEHYEPDIVITACGLRKFNGPAIARVLSKVITKFPILFLTSSTERDPLRARLPQDAILIMKPTPPDAPSDALSTVLKARGE